MVRFFNIAIPSNLSLYVNRIWAVEGDGSREFIHRSAALGLCYAVFHYKGSFDEIVGNTRIRYPLTHFQGQTQKFRQFSTTEAFGLFGVNFYPFVTPLLFNTPSNKITDSISEIETIFKTGSSEFEDKMLFAQTNDERIKIISSFLERRIQKISSKDQVIHQAIRYIINTGYSETVTALAGKFNLSLRQFERKIKEYSGFNPKLFSRIARFQDAFNQCINSKKSVLDIAHSCGYYDQAHFNHDFKKFSGFQPTEIPGFRKNK